MITAKKLNLTRLLLTDNSYYSCGGNNLRLIYLRTLTYGQPYYTKYGFRPVNKKELEIFRYNRELHKNNFNINKKDLVKILLNLNLHNDTIKYIKNNILQLIKENNNVSNFIKLLIKMKDNDSQLCIILFALYMKLYDLLGYKLYENYLFFLNLDEISFTNK